MKYLTSSFSLQMCPDGAHLDIRKGSIEDLFTGDSHYSITQKQHVWIECAAWNKSCLGHQGTVDVLNGIFASRGTKMTVSVNREAISIHPGDTLLVVQPLGERIKYGEEIASPELSVLIVKVLSPISEMREEIWKTAKEEGKREADPFWMESTE